MSEQPTPRTDAVARPGLITAYVTANFARKMERGLCTSASMLGFTDVEIDQLDTVEKLIDAIQKRIAERAEELAAEPNEQLAPEFRDKTDEAPTSILALLHEMWGDAKGGTTYNKSKWMQLQALIAAERAAREQAEARLDEAMRWIGLLVGIKHEGDCEFTDKADEGCYLCSAAQKEYMPKLEQFLSSTTAPAILGELERLREEVKDSEEFKRKNGSSYKEWRAAIFGLLEQYGIRKAFGDGTFTEGWGGPFEFIKSAFTRAESAEARLKIAREALEKMEARCHCGTESCPSTIPRAALAQITEGK